MEALGDDPVVVLLGSPDEFETVLDEPSAPQELTVSGENLEAAILVSAPSGFEVSKQASSGYGSSISFSPSGDAVASSPVYVRLTGAALGIFSGNVTASSDDADDQTIWVSGTVGLAEPAGLYASDETSGGFTANWGSVSGAEKYLLDVSVYENFATDGSVHNLMVKETMGTVSATTTILAHQSAGGFDNADLIMSGSGDVRATTGSSGYDEASGGANVFLTSGGRTFVMEGIDASGYADLKLYFGIYKSTLAEDGSGITLEASADGTAWVDCGPVSLDGGATWFYRTNSLPNSMAVENLRIRFTSAVTHFRIDDVILTGSDSTPSFVSGYEGKDVGNATDWDVSGLDPDTTYYFRVRAVTGTVESDYSVVESATTLESAGPSIRVSDGDLDEFSTLCGTPSEPQSFTVEGFNLTDDIYISAPAGFEVSLDEEDDYDTMISIGAGTGEVEETTVYVRLTGEDAGSFSGDIEVTSVDADEKTKAVAGEVGLEAPVADEATDVLSDGFTANWSEVDGATGYLLDVSESGFDVGAGVVLSENFDGFIAAGGSTDRGTTLNDYTEQPGWTGEKVYEDAGVAKLGTASLVGHLITPTVDLSGNNGQASLSFWSLSWTNDNAQIEVSHAADGSTFVKLGDTISLTESWAEYTREITGGTKDSQIKIEALGTKARFFLNDFVLSQSDELEYLTGYEGKEVGDVTYHEVTGLSPETTYFYRVRATAEDGDILSEYSDVESVETSISPGPHIVVSEDDLDPFETVLGTPSDAQSFTVEGVNLDGDILVEAPDGFEVSLDEAEDYDTEVALYEDGGVVEETPVYVRLTGADPGLFSGHVEVSSHDAITRTKAVGGEVFGPVITFASISLTTFQTVSGEASASQSIAVSGEYLSDDIRVEAPEGFEVSLDDEDFGAYVIIERDGSVVEDAPVYARLAATAAAGEPKGYLVASSEDATDTTRMVYGRVGLATPEANEAEDILFDGFTANWEAVAGAENYRLDVSLYEEFCKPDVAEGDNLLENPGFEDGDDLGWGVTAGVSIVEEDPFDGDYALKAYHATARQDIKQVVELEGDGETSYELSFWYKCEEEGGAGMRIWSSWADGSGMVEELSDNLQPTTYLDRTDEWAFAIYRVVPNEGENTLNFEIRVMKETTGYLDNLFVGLSSGQGCTPSFVDGYKAKDVGDDTECEVTGLDPETTYFYRVRAEASYTVDEDEKFVVSENSNSIEVETAAEAEPIELTVAGAVAVNKAYDGENSATVDFIAAYLVGVEEGDVVELDSSNCSVTFASTDAGEDITVTVIGLTLTGEDAGKYFLKDGGELELTADIEPLAVTIYPDADQSKVYGENDPAFTFETDPGLIDDDKFTGALSRATGEDVGSYAYALGNLSAGGNYDLSLDDGEEFEVTAKELTVTGASAQNKTYDGTTTATITGATLLGVIGTEDVELDLLVGTFAMAGVGTGIDVTANLTLKGAAKDNYTLAQPSGLTADITPKALTVSGAVADNKEYDGTTAATLDTSSAALSGVIASDDVTLDASNASGVFAQAGVGTGISVTVSGLALDGAAEGNYSVTQPTGLSANITVKALTVTGALAQDKVVDGTTDATVDFDGATLSGKVSGDDVTLDSSGYSASFASAEMGTDIAVTVTGLTLDGDDAGNYSLNELTGLKADITAPTDVTFYARVPEWANHIPDYPTIWGPYGPGGSWTQHTMTWDSEIEWWKVTVNVGDATAEFTYQLRFCQDNATKYLKQTGNHDADATFTTTTGEIWIDSVSINHWSGDNFYLPEGKITERSPSLVQVDVTFYVRVPEWVEDTDPVPSVWGPFDGTGDWDGYDFTFDSQLGWWKAEVEAYLVSDAPMTYQLRFHDTEDPAKEKYQKELGDFGADPSFLLTDTEEIWIDASRDEYLEWDPNSADNFAVQCGRITDSEPEFDTVTFYVRAPEWADHDPSDPQIWGEFLEAGCWSGYVMTWDNSIEWWKVDVDVRDATDELAYQLRLFEAGDAKYQKQSGDETFENNPTFTTTTGEIWIDGSDSEAFVWSEGDDFYLPANRITESAPKLEQTITFAEGAWQTKTYGDAPFSLIASASSGLMVSFESLNTSVATVSGSTVTIVGAGQATIKATQAGDDDYYAAEPVERVLTVNKADQTITFEDGAWQTKTYGDANFDLTASASSGLAVSFSSSDTGVATVSGSTVTIVGAGTTTLSAVQAGNANYNEATQVDLVLTVNKKNLTVTDAAAQDKTYDGGKTATPDFSSAQLSGVVGSDSVSLDASNASAVFAQADVGEDIAVSVTGLVLTGNDTGNYTLTQPDYVTADITVKELTVIGVTASNKAYDGGTATTLDASSATLDGVVGSEDVTLDASGASGVFAQTGVGEDIEVTVSGLALDGVDKVNYTLYQPDYVTADFTAL